MSKKCIAFVEWRVNDAVAYRPCNLKVHVKNARFCTVHDKAYRELILGIVVNGAKK